MGQNGSGKTTVTRSIRLLKKNYKPVCEFFETEIDNGDLQMQGLIMLLTGKHYRISIQKTKEMELEWHFARKSTHYINSDKIFVGGIEKAFYMIA